MASWSATPEPSGRALARDVRDSREGEIVVRPDEWHRGGFGFYWLRMNDGRERPVPRRFLQLVEGPR